MKVLIVVSHPRLNSLTFAVTNEFAKGLKESGHKYEILDLYRNKFEPIIWKESEPSNDKKNLPTKVELEIDRLKEYDAMAFVFPIWWYSVPAMLKGYIELVWTNSIIRGMTKFPHQKILWLGLAADKEFSFKKRRLDEMLKLKLNDGWAGYVGIKDSKVQILFDTMRDDEEWIKLKLKKAYDLGINFGK